MLSFLLLLLSWLFAIIDLTISWLAVGCVGPPKRNRQDMNGLVTDVMSSTVRASVEPVMKFGLEDHFPGENIWKRDFSCYWLPWRKADGSMEWPQFFESRLSNGDLRAEDGQRSSQRCRFDDRNSVTMLGITSRIFSHSPWKTMTRIHIYYRLIVIYFYVCIYKYISYIYIYYIILYIS